MYNVQGQAMTVIETVDKISLVTDASILFLPQIDNFHSNWSNLSAPPSPPRHRLSRLVARKKRRTLSSSNEREKTDKNYANKKAVADVSLFVFKHLPLTRSFTIRCFIFVTFSPC